ncbi:MAG: efflux RND transporter periplasmic adaptor subunit [Desulfovibrionales bacterium]
MEDLSGMSKRIRLALKLGIVLVLIGSGWGLASYFIATKPEVKRKKPQPQSVLVEAVSIEKKPARAMISGMGSVVPSQRITLRSKVTGTILSLSQNFLPGGRIPKGSEILRIDPEDYEIQVAQSESELRKAKADLEMEQGKQKVARQEFDLLKNSSPEPLNGTDLALRKPQLHQAEAQVAIAESELARARLNLQRTILSAPFNALVVDRQVNLGTHVGVQEHLATLVATDEYWIEAAVPADRLSLLEAETDMNARIFSQTGGGDWTGRVMHSLGTLKEDSRLAKVLISVQRPLESGPVPLMLGDYVRVEIKGRDLGEMFVLPRIALRRGDSVWIASDGRLEIRSVDVALKNGERVYIRDGLLEGEKLILSDIAAPVQGMAVDVDPNDPTETNASDSPDPVAESRDSEGV